VADAQSLSATTGRLAAAGILFAASLGIAIAGIHFHIVGAMVKPLGQAFGWGRGEVAFALTISAAIHPFTNILVGSLADRHGPRAVLMPGVPLFCLGLAMVGFAGPSIGSWYVLYGIFALLGGGISSVVWTMLIVDRFQTRRGLALAVSLSGAGLLVSIVPTIVLALDNVVGVNGIYPAFGLTAFVLLMPAVYFLVPRQRFTSPVERAPALAASERRTILRSRRFWQLGLAFLLVASCVGTFIVHLQPILTDAGLTREDAARIGLLVGPALVVGRLTTGFLFDTLPTRLVAGVAFALPAVACGLLAYLPLDFTVAASLAVLIGLAMGSEVDVVAYLSSRYFGLRNYGFVFGAMISVYAFAVGVAGWAVGVGHDAIGDYTPILVILMGFSVGACMLVLTLGNPPPAGFEDAVLPDRQLP